MCRALCYLGPPLSLDKLLYLPDNSLVKQSYDPIYMKIIQNLAGFGMSVWNSEDSNVALPFIYRTANLPFFDRNLKNYAKNFSTTCLIAHVRGVMYSVEMVVSRENAHPFSFKNIDLNIAHNGSLAEFEEYKYDLIKYIRYDLLQQIKGTTDSEWIAALLLSQLKNPYEKVSQKEVCAASLKALDILSEVQKQKGIKISSPVNLFMSNGDFIISTRFVINYGYFPKSYSRAHLVYHSLWYTCGEKFLNVDGKYRMVGTDETSAIIISSEPLTEDSVSWVEVEEYSIVSAYRENGKVKLETHDIPI